MKKQVYVVVFIIMLLCFVGCGKKEGSAETDEKKNIETVADSDLVFPDILGEDEEKAISLLEKQGYYVQQGLHNDNPEEMYGKFSVRLPRNFQEIVLCQNATRDDVVIVMLTIFTVEDKVIGAWGLINTDADCEINAKDFVEMFKVAKKEKLKFETPENLEWLDTAENGGGDSRLTDRLVYKIKQGEFQICTHRFFMKEDKAYDASWEETRPFEFMLLGESMLQPEYEMSEEERQEIIENEDQYAGYYVAEDNSYIMIYQEETDYYVEINISNAAFMYGTGKLSDNQMVVEAIDEQSGKTIKIVFDYRFEQELITMRVEDSQLESLPNGMEMDYISDTDFSTVPSFE